MLPLFARQPKLGKCFRPSSTVATGYKIEINDYDECGSVGWKKKVHAASPKMYPPWHRSRLTNQGGWAG